MVVFWSSNPGGRHRRQESFSAVAQQIPEKPAGALGEKGRAPWNGYLLREGPIYWKALQFWLRPSSCSPPWSHILRWQRIFVGLLEEIFTLGCRVVPKGYHWIWLIWRCAFKGWFSLEVYSDSVDLTINMGSCASQANKAHHSQLPIYN